MSESALHTYSVLISKSLGAEINFLFNVFHVRVLYYTKTLITNKCTMRVLSSVVTHSYMFRPCWVIFRENFSVIFTLSLHCIPEWECTVDCVLRCFWRRELSAVPACRGEFTPPIHSTQSTAHSHSNMKCNLSVKIKKKFPLKMTQQCRNV
jgi:hypothetical protein